MSPLFDKRSALDRKLKRVQKELSSLDSNIRTLGRSPVPPASRPVLSADVLREDTRRANGARPAARAIARDLTAGTDRLGTEATRGHAPTGSDSRGERFSEYLSSNFQTTRPLARERNVQRNKAIVITVFVLVLLTLILYRIFAG
jgi:hypothetical protein